MLASRFLVPLSYSNVQDPLIIHFDHGFSTGEISPLDEIEKLFFENPVVFGVFCITILFLKIRKFSKILYHIPIAGGQKYRKILRFSYFHISFIPKFGY
jgi:hypothetical protein